MAMWQNLGMQELVYPGTGGILGGGATIRTHMWRSAVPGGWIVVFANGISVTTSFFYPDTEYKWDGRDAMADYLLRASDKAEEE